MMSSYIKKYLKLINFGRIRTICQQENYQKRQVKNVHLFFRRSLS